MGGKLRLEFSIVILVCFTLDLVSLSEVTKNNNETKIANVQQLSLPLKNFTDVSGAVELESAPSNKQGKRQNGRSQSTKGKLKGYSGPNGYLKVYESEPQSYSTSYHHKSEDPKEDYATSSRSSHGDQGRDHDDHESDTQNDSNSRGKGRRHNSRSRPSRRQYDDADDDDYSTQFDSGTKGYNTNNKYNNEERNDYKKSGKLDDDFDHHDFEDDRGSSRRKNSRKDRNNDEYGNGRDSYIYSKDRGDDQDEYRGDTSSNYRESLDGYDNGQFDEVDGYGENSNSRRGRSQSRSNNSPDRDRYGTSSSNDFIDYEQSNSDTDKTGGNQRPRSKSNSNEKYDEKFDFAFNVRDPYGEDPYRKSDRGYLSPTPLV